MKPKANPEYLLPIFTPRMWSEDYRYVNVFKRGTDYYMSRYVTQQRADVNKHDAIYRINIIPKK